MKKSMVSASVLYAIKESQKSVNEFDSRIILSLAKKQVLNSRQLGKTDTNQIYFRKIMRDAGYAL